MRPRAVVTVSLIAHGALFAVLARVPFVRGKRVAATVAAPAPAPVTVDDTVAVVLIPEAERVPDTAAVTVTATAAVAAAAPATAAVTAPDPDLLHMRSATSSTASPSTESPGSRLPGADLHGGGAHSILEGIADRPDAPTPPDPVKPSGLLHPTGGDTARIDDAVTTVTVERDGTAHFHDKPDFDIHFHLPSLGALRNPERAWNDAKQGLGEWLRDWYADPYATARGGPSTDLPETALAVPGERDIAMPNNVAWPESGNLPAPPPAVIVPVISGKADATDYLMRKLHVGDPYASRKRALLDKTFAERVQAGGTYRAEQLDRSAELMRRNLEQLWAHESSPAARRAALFALWDECAEGDGPLGEAGQRARKQVIGWIAVHLPRGSADAYTPAELAELAKHQQSAQAFEPY